MPNSSSFEQIDLACQKDWKPPGKEAVYNVSKHFLEWYKRKCTQEISTPRKTEHNMPTPASKMSPVDVLQGLKNLQVLCAAEGDGPKQLLSSGSSNTKLVGPIGNQRHVIGDKNKKKNPRDLSWKQIGRATQILHNFCENKVYRTLRSFYYTDKTLFIDQSKANALIHEVAIQLNCTRSSLNVFATDRGSIIGNVSFLIEDKLRIDCNDESKHEIKCMLGKTIPPFLCSVSHINVEDDVHFVVFVEKYSVFLELAQHNFHNDYHCIIITGSGHADLVSKEFTKMLMNQFHLPAFCLVDCDAFGIEIFTIIKHGSVNAAYDSKNLACTAMYWLGINPSDLTTFNIPYDLMEDGLDIEAENVAGANVKELDEEYGVVVKRVKDDNTSSKRKEKRNEKKKFTELDKLESLSMKEYVMDDEKLKFEVDYMKQHRMKTSLENLNALGIHYLAEFYVPSKLLVIMEDIMRYAKY